MRDFMIQLGIMSLQAAVIIGIVIVLRGLFHLFRISKKYTMLLWMISFFYMVCPLKIEVPVGFWNNASVGVSMRNEEYWEEENQKNDADGEKVLSEKISENVPEHTTDNLPENLPDKKEKNLQDRMPEYYRILFFTWLFGVMGIVVFNLVSYVRLKNRLSRNLPMEDGTFLVDEIPVPLVFGIIHPKIYLPSGLEEAWRFFVVEHEKTHIKRHDPLMKIIAFTITGIHWFNPMAWVAWMLFVRDMEMACDEETLLRLGLDKKKDYAGALLMLSSGSSLRRRMIFAAPVAFDEGSTKKRIRNILKYKKTVRIAAFLAVVLCIATGALFLTRTKDSIKLSQIEGYESLKSTDSDTWGNNLDEIYGKEELERLSTFSNAYVKQAGEEFYVAVLCFDEKGIPCTPESGSAASIKYTFFDFEKEEMWSYPRYYDAREGQVGAYGVCELDGEWYEVMDYVDGETNPLWVRALAKDEEGYFEVNKERDAHFRSHTIFFMDQSGYYSEGHVNVDGFPSLVVGNLINPLYGAILDASQVNSGADLKEYENREMVFSIPLSANLFVTVEPWNEQQGGTTPQLWYGFTQLHVGCFEFQGERVVMRGKSILGTDSIWADQIGIGEYNGNYYFIGRLYGLEADRYVVENIFSGAEHEIFSDTSFEECIQNEMINRLWNNAVLFAELTDYHDPYKGMKKVWNILIAKEME